MFSVICEADINNNCRECCCCRPMYRSEDFESLQVSAEVNALFEYVKKCVSHSQFRLLVNYCQRITDTWPTAISSPDYYTKTLTSKFYTSCIILCINCIVISSAFCRMSNKDYEWMNECIPANYCAVISCDPSKNGDPFDPSTHWPISISDSIAYEKSTWQLMNLSDRTLWKIWNASLIIGLYYPHRQVKQSAHKCTVACKLKIAL